MKRLELIKKLNRLLLQELPQYEKDAELFSQDVQAQRQLLRSLMNVRPPLPLQKEFLNLQDELLSYERKHRSIVDGMQLPTVQSNDMISIWRGDITTIMADAIVNAANSALLGCFYPCHCCIDNAIHSAAGLSLRMDIIFQQNLYCIPSDL